MSGALSLQARKLLDQAIQKQEDEADEGISWGGWGSWGSWGNANFNAKLRFEASKLQEKVVRKLVRQEERKKREEEEQKRLEKQKACDKMGSRWENARMLEMRQAMSCS